MKKKNVGNVLRTFRVVLGGLGLLLLISGQVLAVDYNSVVQHAGEKIYHNALLRVEKANGQVLLWVGLAKPESVAPDLTMSYCGKEVAPSFENLTGMVGKPFMGWMTYEKGKGAIHRLEFQCQ